MKNNGIIWHIKKEQDGKSPLKNQPVGLNWRVGSKALL